MHKFTFFDTESTWDQDLHAGYKTIEPDLYSYRIGSKRIFAASAFDLTLDAQGQITCERISSWTEHQYGDEEAVVAHLFDHLRARPDYTAVGFGSIATDVSVLTLAAMEYGIQRPRQFRSQRPATTLNSLRAHPGGHLDLGLALKGRGKTWHHMWTAPSCKGCAENLIGSLASICPACGCDRTWSLAKMVSAA